MTEIGSLGRVTPTVLRPVVKRLSWPQLTNAADGAAFQSNGEDERGTVACWDAGSFGVGGGRSMVRAFDGIWGAEHHSGASFMGQLGVWLPLDQLTGAHQSFGSPWPVIAVTTVLAIVADTGAGWNAAPNDSGLYWCPAGGTSPGAPSGNNAFFGLILDDNGAAYRWKSRSIVGAALQEDTAVSWPGPLTQPARVEWWFFGATADTPARVECWVNGSQLISRSWGAGTALPDYTVIASGSHFRMRHGTGTTSPNGNQLFLGPVIWEIRTTDRDGVEV